MIWDTWKKGFDVWENATAKWLEITLKSPLILEPAGKALTAVMKAKTAREDAMAKVWHGMGLPSRRDQERLMHSLNQLNSRLLDLEEEGHTARRENRKALRKGTK
jgi:hypothetical protein